MGLDDDDGVLSDGRGAVFSGVRWVSRYFTEQPGLERNINPNPRIYHLPTYVNLRLLNNVYHEVDISLPKCKLDRN